MEQYAIRGGNPLVGEVEIGGAKNASLAILAAAVMTDDTVTIENIPDVRDTNVMMQAIESIGGTVERVDRHTARISGKNIKDLVIEGDYIKKIRASYYLLGALLGKYKKAQVSLPGGCNIGLRPIDQHIKGFRALGADVKIANGLIFAEAQKLNFHYLELMHILFSDVNPIPVKTAMNLFGYEAGECRLPLVPMSVQGYHDLKDCMEKYDLLSKKVK